MFIPLHTVLPLAQDNQMRMLAIGSEARPGGAGRTDPRGAGRARIRDRSLVRAARTGRDAAGDRRALQRRVNEILHAPRGRR